MHARQSSFYLCMVEIKSLEHIHVQKYIKVGKLIENMSCQEVVRS